MEKLTQFLSTIADYLVYDLFGITQNSVFGNALHYFLIGFTEIVILVILVTYLMGIITSYLPMDKIRVYLEKNKKSGLGNIMASLLGAITPFCSCSSIPLFVGMMQARIPLGIALSFLITSPLVNEIAIAIFWVTYGWKVTVIYVLTGIILGVVGGILLEKLGMAKYVANWVKELGESKAEATKDTRTFMQRLPEINNEALTTLKKLVPYIFLGLAIGSFIHGYVPQSFFETYISKTNPFAVPIAVLLAIPLYIDAVGVLPIIESLIEKGVPLGTAIAFMMASIGLSFPEALLLKKVMQKKLIIAFFSTIGIGMIISGFFFNLIF
ncbi:MULTISPECIES: permease [unclassified Tenacibaculum]|uniref:permease n=1 Tax=unclassified Tenacibaculum TaxID=2635139 RepID=UPI001F27E274|nr:MULTISPECIES: permease [unclassified Tenacibaculum]MCF2876528.1 permease [Tenacibaculum sp. Cn5-1]MCF2936565.1 permease [Tenacibaculum sp. Cn5-34]MCG7511842.1 permease [Tenacibaculum sp. Cn5-46]